MVAGLSEFLVLVLGNFGLNLSVLVNNIRAVSVASQVSLGCVS